MAEGDRVGRSGAEAAQARTGADMVAAILRDEGVERVFGNPGSTELALVDAIAQTPGLDYVLALHEGVVVAMADGYAQATGRTAFVNLHTVSGLGNAIGMLANVKANRTPMVVTAGQQERHLLAGDPLLGYDLVALAAPVCKWAAEVHTAEELALLLRRAFLDAAAEPAGPVFLSIPHDVVAGAAPAAWPERSIVHGAGVAAGTDELARLLVEGANVAIVLGHEAAAAAVLPAVEAVARRLGARVFAAFHTQRAPFPPRHPLWSGDLPGVAAQVRTTLEPFDTIFFIGGQAFQLFAGEGPVLPQGARLLHLAPDPSPLGRVHPTRLGLHGDIAATLRVLEQAVDALPRCSPGPSAPAAPSRTPDVASSIRLDGATAARILCEALPRDAILYHEFPALGPALREMFDWTSPGQFFASKQTIGWAMGAAIGIGLGHDRRQFTIAVVGDGSAAFSLPALWSAARENVPVIFAVMDNRRYEILARMSGMMSSRRPNASPAFDLSTPPLDFVAIAAGMGVPGMHVGDSDALREAMKQALAEPRPFLLQIAID